VRWRYLALFFLICAGYLATLSDTDFGWISDGRVMLDTAVNLHEFGELAIGYDFDPVSGREVAKTGSFGKYGIGLSLIEQIPLIFSGPMERALGGGRSNVLFALTNMLVTACTALVVALIVRDLGCGFRASALAAAGFAFGTFAWPYISYDFSEPVQSLSVSTGIWLLVRSVRAPQPDLSRRIGLALAASALGFAVLTKAVLLLVIPACLLYLWLGLEGPPSRRLRSFAWFGVALAACGLLIASLNQYRFGSILEFGYKQESGQFTTPLSEGLYGLIASPNKGLIFYAPLALLLPWSLWRSRLSHRREVLLLVSILAPYVLAISKYFRWDGGASWGPRYLVPVLPLIAVGAALLLDSKKWWVWPFATCLAAGVAINLLGVLVNFMVWLSVAGLHDKQFPLDLRGRPAREYVERDGRRWFPAWIAINYEPSLSPILGHAWLLRLRYLDRPFPVQLLDKGSSAPAPTVPYGPVQLEFARLGDGFSLLRLRSAHLWLWDRLSGTRRDPILAVPVHGASLQRLGSAAERSNPGRAVECYTRAAAMMPDSSGLALKLSRLQSERGSPRDAERTLLRYLARHPRAEAARLQLGRVYDSMGDRAAALREYRAYLTVAPAADNRAAVEQRIVQLLSRPP